MSELLTMELGAGGRPRPEYNLHQDIRALPGIDVVCDVRALPPEYRGKLKCIFGYHVMEHVPWREIQKTVDHWVDWLAPGGVLHMIVPDFQRFAEWLVAYPNDENLHQRVLYMSQGGQDYPENTHLCGPTPCLMRKWFLAAHLKLEHLNRVNNKKPVGEHCPMLDVKGRKQ